MQRWCWWTGVVACVLGACEDERPAPPGAPVSGDHSFNAPDREDAGTDKRDAGDDPGSKPDAGLVTSNCVRVRALTGDPEDTPSVTYNETPADFSVTRQAEQWTVSDCEHPKLTLALSDGLCPRGQGHELTFEFALNAIADGTIHAGNNQLLPDSEAIGLRVRYTRPSPLVPRGVWGSCADVAGQLIFLDEPQARAGAVLDARYELTLTACDGTAAEPQVLLGSFRHELRYGLSRFCPNRMD